MPAFLPAVQAMTHAVLLLAIVALGAQAAWVSDASCLCGPLAAVRQQQQLQPSSPVSAKEPRAAAFHPTSSAEPLSPALPAALVLARNA